MTRLRPSRFRRSLVSCLLLTLPLAAACASGMETGAYLKIRAASRYDRKLTYAAAQSDPAAAVGRVIELRGSINGAAESEDGALVILGLSDGASVTVQIPPKETAWLKRYSNLSLRVLAKISSNPNGNVIPLEVLAIAEDNEIGREEARRDQEQAEQEAQRRNAARERERNAARQALGGGTRGGLPSRHAPARSFAGNSAPPVPIGGANDAAYAPFLSARARPLLPAYQNYIAQQNPALRGAQAAQIAASLLHFADRYGVDPRLIVAMIMAESHFNPQATSRHGAMGLGQLMPGTARSLGVNNAYDPVQNLQGSIGYLRSRLDTFADRSLPGGGLTFEQVRLAMAAYNAGTGAVKKYGGVPPYRETQAYVQRIERLYRQLIGQ